MNEIIAALTKLSPEGWTAVGFMAVLIAWFALEVLRSASNLSAERLLLEQLRPAAVMPSEDEPLEEGALDKFDDLLKNQPRSSLVHRVTRAVLNSRMVNNPDIEAIVSLLLSREAVQLGVVRNVPNLLMLVGLLGTVFGLAASVGGLSQQIAQSIQAGNVDALSNALIKTLGQMQGAFGATLYGILASVVTSLVLGFISSARGKFAAELQDFVLIDLVPAVFPRSSAQQLEQQRRIAKDSQKGIQQLKDVLDKAVVGFDEILGKTGQRVEQSLEELGDASEKALKAFDQVMTGVSELKIALKEGADNLALSQKQSAQIFSIAAEDLKQQLSGQGRQINDFQKTFLDGSSKILERIDGVSGRLDNTVKAFRDESTSHLNFGNKILDRLDVRFERLEVVLSKTKQES
jgi:gas vesicle protein